MELKTLITSIKTHMSILALCGLFGGLIGLGIYFWPAKYITTGSFYIKRGVDTSNDFFTYEGYYGQQTATGFTNTVIALFESEDLQGKALDKAGLPVSSRNLQKFAKNTKVTKYGPQLITLTIKGNDATETNKLWRYLAEVTTQKITDINATGDPKLAIIPLVEQPVSKRAYKSVWIDVPAGIIAGLSLGVFLLSIKTYD